MLLKIIKVLIIVRSSVVMIRLKFKRTSSDWACLVILSTLV